VYACVGVWMRLCAELERAAPRAAALAAPSATPAPTAAADGAAVGTRRGGTCYGVLIAELRRLLTAEGAVATDEAEQGAPIPNRPSHRLASRPPDAERLRTVPVGARAVAGARAVVDKLAQCLQARAVAHGSMAA
jgi:hypothetical protein